MCYNPSKNPPAHQVVRVTITQRGPKHIFSVGDLGGLGQETDFPLLTGLGT